MNGSNFLWLATLPLKFVIYSGWPSWNIRSKGKKKAQLHGTHNWAQNTAQSYLKFLGNQSI